MPQLLREIVVGMVSSERDMEIVGEACENGGLSELVQETDPDVVIAACETGEVGPLGRMIVGRAPALLAIVDDGRRGLLHELRPKEVDIGELTPAKLVAAIRNLKSFAPTSEQ